MMFLKRKNLKANFGIKKKLLCIFVLFTAIPFFVVAVFFYLKTSAIITDLAAGHSAEQLELINSNFEDEVNDISTDVLHLRWNYTILERIAKQDKLYRSQKILNGSVVDALRDISSTHGFDSAYILTEKENLYTTDERYTPELIRRIWEQWGFGLTEENKPVRVVSMQNPFSDSETNYMISFVVRVTKITEDGELKAVLVCSKSFSSWMLESELRSYGREILITDDMGRRVFTLSDELRKNAQELFSGEMLDGDAGYRMMRINEKPYLAVWENMPIPGFKVIKVTPDTAITGNLNTLAVIAAIICAVIVTASVLTNIMLSKGIVRPIEDLRMTIINMEPENKKLQSRHDEIGDLSRSYSAMMQKQTDMIRLIEQTNKKKREMELNLLAAQINPHFIYNAINSIRSIAVIQGNKAVANSLQSLSRLLHASIHIGRNFITIREEFDQIQNYVQLQKMRYMESFEVSYDIDSELFDKYTLSFLLQPIVENAIFHGAENTEEKCLITVSIKKAETGVIYHVSDNGRGIAEKRLADLNALLDSELFSVRSEHVGLKNISDRLKLFFGEDQLLQIKSEQGRGTQILVRIPLLDNIREMEL